MPGAVVLCYAKADRLAIASAGSNERVLQSMSS